MTQSKKTTETSGLAATRQRSYILECIQNRKNHPDADAIYQAVSKTMPSISLDTVYRTLSLFARKGLIQQLAVPTHRFRYDGCVEPHDHFVCTRCERIEDVPNVAGVSSPLPEEVRQIGTVQSAQRTYLGVCKSCADHEPERAGHGTRRPALHLHPQVASKNEKAAKHGETHEKQVVEWPLSKRQAFGAGRRLSKPSVMETKQ